MNFLKRVEVWLLLLAGAAVSIWVLMPPEREASDSFERAQEAGIDAPALQILRCTLERDFGNARLDVELRYRNESPRPLILAPPDARLLAGETEVPPFILPAEKLVEIPARTTQEVRLRYWLEKKHLESALTLEIRDAKAEVKSAASLELDALENRKPKVWQGPILP